MADSIKTILTSANVLNTVILPTGIDAMLSGLEVTAPAVFDGDGIAAGTVTLSTDLSNSPIPGFDFTMTLPTLVPPDGMALNYKLKLDSVTAGTTFQFWLILADQANTFFNFNFITGQPGFVLTGATKSVDADGIVTLTKLPDDPPQPVRLVSRSPEAGAALGPVLLISGSPSIPANVRFTSDTDSTSGITSFGLEPAVVVFGDSGIGFECPVVVIDDSETDKAPGDGAPALDPPLAVIDADTPAWRGLLARDFDFYLPPSVPLFGGRAIKAFFAIGRGPGGTELAVESKVPARGASATLPAQPGYAIRIECMDPTANGLSGLVPTLISASMELPLDQAGQSFVDDKGVSQGITFAAGKPVLVTATLARDPVNDPGQFKITLGVASQGADGLLSVTSTGPGGAKIFDTSVALATALIADKNVANGATVGGTPGVVIYALLAAGTALSSLFTDDSQFVLHGVEIESSGHGSPLGGPIVMTLDYSVAVRVTKIDVGVLSVSMNPDQPMRIRLRSVRMSLDPHKGGLDMIGLDFARAEMEIENPGAWNVEGLDSLFDVLRSRSGRGSSWIEVDLRFKLNLGPISVSGATIRATLNDDGSIAASIRGLDAGLHVPGAIDATGGLQLLSNGFSATLLAQILPLNLNADADVIYAPPMIVLRLGVDLPAPIPLASSGFGLFGIGGLLGFSAVPDYGADADSDPVLRQLKWTPDNEHSFQASSGESTFGLSAVVGTLPDLGFSFSAKAGVLISVPDIAVRGSLNGKVLQPAVKISDPGYPPSAGISFLGFIGIDSEALSFGLLGEVNLKPLLDIHVPLAGYYPFDTDETGVVDWYTYLGADGYPGGTPNQGRSIGPISARVLPDILDIGADAYLMLRGNGIENWPYGRAMPSGPLTLTDGFVIAFGFSLQNTFGVEPIVWAELYASLDLLLGSKPPTIAGFGRAGGSLNLGPFSLGVQAQVSFMLSAGTQYFWAEVSGKIDLFFCDIEGHVTVSVGDLPTPALPLPELHPLDRLDANGNRAGSVGVITDDTYRVIASLVEDPALITNDMRVWPDALVSLPFTVNPDIIGAAASQFPAIIGPGATPAPGTVGAEMLHYTWQLNRFDLVDVTDEADPMNGPGTAPAGQLSARWQTPRSVLSGGDVSELVLFSNGPDLWMNRLADGGAGLSGNPMQQAANLCQASISAQIGWAVGVLAGRDSAGFRLPPDPVSTSPFLSRVEARMHHVGLASDNQGTALDDAHALPAPFSIQPAVLIFWSKPEDLKHIFTGHLVAPSLTWLSGRPLSELLQGGYAFTSQRVRLDLTEAIVQGQLVLVANPLLFNIRENISGLRVFDDTGEEWLHADPVPIPTKTGDAAGTFRPQTDHVVSQLLVNYPLGASIGIVGVGGLTVSARDYAAAENLAIATEAARQQMAAGAGPKTDPTTNTASQRVILEPGRLYRIDADFFWAGVLSKQDDTGALADVERRDYDAVDTNNVSTQATYIPTGGGEITTLRHLFFKTTPKPADRNVVPHGDAKQGYWLRTQQDVFQPEMLQRFLAGYEPAQSEQFRFFADPLRAHFTQDHVAALAKAYDFDLVVAVRRVDRPGDSYATPTFFPLVWSASTNRAFLSETDKLRFDCAVASACTVPKPGATATMDATLEPEAWYELYVLARSLNVAFTDGRLPGVTFKTSQWGTPPEMLRALGFTVDAVQAPPPTGDLAIAAPSLLSPAVVLDDDQAFQNALLTLGLDGWPVADAPRLSLLWTVDAGSAWLFAGLMIESPEPIHRAGRISMDGLNLQMGRTGVGILFDVLRRDRSGSRLLFLTSTPFTVVTRERIVGIVKKPIGLPFPVHPWPPQWTAVTPTLLLNATSLELGVATPLAGTLIIPALPGFAEDP